MLRILNKTPTSVGGWILETERKIAIHEWKIKDFQNLAFYKALEI